MRFAGVIFDMDDLLIRSAHIWQRSERALLDTIGHAWTPELAIQYKGMNALDVAATIHRLLRPALSLSECQRILRSTLIDGFARDVEAMPGAVDLVNRLRGRVPMAVASGSPMEAIRLALALAGIADAFDQVVTSESVPRGKPHPDAFLAAAAALGVAPAGCLVFEDSLIGVTAGVAAGMTVYAVPSGSVDEIRRLATAVHKSLADVPAEAMGIAIGP